VNLLLTPTVTLQMYLQPLLGAGRYWPLKELARPRTFDFSAYGEKIGTISYDPASALYLIDADGSGPSAPFTVDNLDFNEKTLRVQTVFRWEWRPGSRLYVVWSQQRYDDRDPGRFTFGRDARRIFTAPADDVLAVKLTYWLGR
jgi:hypothetical protein